MYSAEGCLEYCLKLLKFISKKECLRRYLTVRLKIKLTPEKILVRVTLFHFST